MIQRAARKQHTRCLQGHLLYRLTLGRPLPPPPMLVGFLEGLRSRLQQLGREFSAGKARNLARDFDGRGSLGEEEAAGASVGQPPPCLKHMLLVLAP
eukprot:419671-Hanusia_phi.AAC.1